jgi:hypothetical protein
VFRINALTPALIGSMDPSIYIPIVTVWSDTEIAAAVVALSMPSLKPIFDHLFSNSPMSSSDPNPPKGSANSDDRHMMTPMHGQKHRSGIVAGTATDINDIEKSLWVDENFFPADPHDTRNSSAHIVVWI